MQETEFIFSLVFALFAFGLIYPPTEFESIGLTINNVFATYLGSIDIEFVQYHLRRTCLTLCIHTMLPTLYIVCYYLKFGQIIEYDTGVFLKFILWNSFVIIGIILPVITAYIIYNWCKDDFAKHPLAQNLKKYNRDNWLRAAVDVNSEYRRYVWLFY